MGSRVARIGFWIKIILFYFTFSFCTFGNHQGWEFALLLITLLLKIAHYKELLWANCSGRSPKMINHERFALRSLTKNEWIAQVTHDKRATWVNRFDFSEWIALLLTKNEWFTQKYLHKLVFFVSLKKTSTLLTHSFLKRCELWSDRSQKWATVSKSLTKNKQQWASCSPKMSELGNCLFFWATQSFVLFLAKNEWFAEKTLSQFPTLRTTIKTQNRPTLLYKGVCSVLILY